MRDFLWLLNVLISRLLPLFDRLRVALNVKSASLLSVELARKVKASVKHI